MARVESSSFYRSRGQNATTKIRRLSSAWITATYRRRVAAFDRIGSLAAGPVSRNATSLIDGGVLMSSPRRLSARSSVTKMYSSRGCARF